MLVVFEIDRHKQRPDFAASELPNTSGGEQIRHRQMDSQRLIQRNKNLKADLEKKQHLEFKRAEAAIKSILSNPEQRSSGTSGYLFCYTFPEMRGCSYRNFRCCPEFFKSRAKTRMVSTRARILGWSQNLPLAYWSLPLFYTCSFPSEKSTKKLPSCSTKNTRRNCWRSKTRTSWTASAQESRNVIFCPSHEKFKTGILNGGRNISDTL